MSKELAISLTSDGSHVPLISTSGPIIVLSSTTWRQPPPRLPGQFMFQPTSSLEPVPNTS